MSHRKSPISPNPTIGRRSTNALIVVVVALSAALLQACGSDAPTEANLDDATAELTTSTAESSEAETTTSEAEAETDADADTSETPTQAESSGDNSEGADISGDWTVDTSVGEFSFADSTGTFVGFRVGEELTTVGETEAVGRTPEVSGSITIDGTTVTAALIEADMTAITTDISRRDGATRRALDTDNYPTATFELTEPIDLGDNPTSGDPITTTATGDLTIHGETNPVEVAIDAQYLDGTIVIIGSTDITFADYGIEAPSAPVVARVDDFGVIEFQLFLTR